MYYMKKRTLLLQNGGSAAGYINSVLPPGCPPVPDPDDYGNPQNPGDPGWDEYEQAVEDWHDAFDDWNDAGRPGPGGTDPCGTPEPNYFWSTSDGKFQAGYTDPETGEYKTVNQDSTDAEKQAYQDAVNSGHAIGPNTHVIP